MEHIGVDFPIEVIREGITNVAIPKLEFFKRGLWDYAPAQAPVFYNPRMRTCRDIAVLALQSYQKLVGRDLNVSEPLAGCGVRGIRFAREVEGIRSVYINDISERAYQLAKYNVLLNNLEDKVFVSNDDANLFLGRHAAPKNRFDFIDIDPFGSPAPYLDSAIRALRDGGLLALTATDMAPLCGVYPRVALRKYGGVSLRTEYCHEIAVRLLAGCLASVAARHNIGIKVLFSHSTRHYIRLYTLVEYGAKKADEALKNMGYILHCFKCFHRETHQDIMLAGHNSKCPECGSIMRATGPLWLGGIVDENFCRILKENLERENFSHIGHEARKIISMVRDEINAPITYYVIDKICDKIGIPTPPLREVILRLSSANYRALRTHFHAKGVKTDAPASTVIEIIRGIAERQF
ncbi:MAG: tRNA (guanine(10)-N(2))-dimethyltransferase [Candidatus Bathyarchaeia archaeon]